MPEEDNRVRIPAELMDCVFLFLHQVDINDYQTADGLHSLKDNAYWPAMKSFHDLAIKAGKKPSDPELMALVKTENDARIKYLPPKFIPANEQETKDKAWIDAQSFESLLDLWRNAPCGHRMFVHGPVADYYAARMSYLRNLEPDNGVSASKQIGWG